MALKKPTQTESSNNTASSKFEAEPGTAEGVTQAAVAETAAETVDQETGEISTPKDAGAQATTAIATAAASSALSTQDAANAAKQFKKDVEEMKGASDFSYGNYNVFKANNGEIACTETNESFGRWVKVRLMSWDDHVEVSPGEQSASTKEFVAYSKDGKVIDSVIGEDQRSFVGKSVDEYLTYLRDQEDFSKAKARRFIDTACAVLGSDSGDGPIGQVVQITLSESSIPAFAKHQQNLADNARAVAMGLPGFKLPEDPFTFYFIREVAQKGDNKWTKLRISSTLPNKI